jgi:hypothetical protein
MELCDIGRKAAFSLMRKLELNRIWAPDLMLRCFDVQVRSLLSYGAEVWGPDALREVLGTRGRQRVKEWLRRGQRAGTGLTGESAELVKRWGGWVKNGGNTAGVFEKAMADPMVGVQKLFLRKVVGASLPPNRLLFAETSQLPLHYFWAQQVFGFWKRLVKQPNSLARAVLEEDVRAWLDPDYRTSEHEYFWAGKVLRIFATLGFDYNAHIDQALSTEDKARAIVALDIPFDDLLLKFRRRLLLDWTSTDLDRDPRGFPEYADRAGARGAGVTACRYLKWMGVAYTAQDHKLKLSHLRASMPRKHHTALMRFRLGRWDLEVSRLARGPGRRPRAERICRVCSTQGAVEDELHVLIECPVYEPLRRAVNVPADPDMREVMTKIDQCKLGNLLYQVQVLRKERLRN